MSISLTILGAGVQGASLALRLQANPMIDVTIVDANPASGASGKQDGRLHSGGTGVPYDSVAVLKRKVAGNAAIRTLFPECIDTGGPAVYGFACDLDAGRYLAKAASAGVPFQRTVPADEIRAWFGAPVCHFYEVLEDGFDTARLTAGFLNCARAAGAVLVRDHARDVSRTADGGYAVTLASGAEIRADVVVNALGAYSADVTVDGEARMPEGQIASCWPIGYVCRAGLPNTDRVLVVADPETRMGSVVPHRGVYAVDGKPAFPTTIRSASDIAKPNPRGYDPEVPGERTMVDMLRHRFAPLGQLPDTAFRIVYCAHLRSEPVPDRPLATVSDLLAITQPMPGYFQRLGGLATTSVLDAVDAAEIIERAVGAPVVDPLDGLMAMRRDGSPCGPVDARLLYAAE